MTDDHQERCLLNGETAMFLKTNGGTQERRGVEAVGWTWIVAFIVGLIVIVGASHLYHSHESELIAAGQNDILESIARLKAAQVTNWRKERIQDVSRYVNNPVFGRDLKDWMQDGKDTALEERLRKMNIVERDSEGFTDMTLTDLDGGILMTTAHDDTVVAPEQKIAIREVLSTGRALMSDPYLTDSERILIDVLAPVTDSEGKPFAVAVMTSDAKSSLFEILSFWPTKTDSAESCLVKQVGSDIVALTLLRGHPESALKFRVPVKSPNIPAAQAIRGVTGIFEGLDYRGTEVVSYLSRIPDSSWFMVTKIDKSEIYSEVVYRTYVYTVLTVFLILFAVMGIGFFFKARQVGLYQRLYKAEQDKRSSDEEREEALQRLELALKGADLGVWDWHVQTGELFQDEVWLSQLGYAVDDVANNIASWEDRIHPEDRPSVMKAMEECLSGNSPSYSAEHRLLTKSGDYKWILTRGRVLERDAEGKPVRMLGTHLDINKSKVAEASLENSERMFRTLVGAIDDVFWVSDPNISGVNYVSPAYEKVWGHKTEELIKNPRSFLDVIHPDDRDRVVPLLMAAHEQGREYSVEYRILVPDGTIRWILDRGYPILDESGNLAKMCGTCSDITERKRNEENLRAFKTISDKSNSGNAISDLEGKILYLNEAFASMHGFSIEECIGQHLSMFHTEDQMPAIVASMDTLKNRGSFETLELWHRRKDGSVFPTLMNGAMVSDEKGLPMFLSTTVIDITQLKKAEQDLHESEELFRTVFFTSPDAMAINRLSDGVYIDINDSLAQLSGFSREEVIGKNFRGLDLWANEDERDEYRSALREVGRINNYEAQYRLRDGQIKTGLVSGAILELNGVPHALSVVRDIDEMKKGQTARAILATAVDQAAERVVITDVHGVIVYVNPAFEITTGFSPEEVVGHNPSIIKSGLHDGVFYEKMWKTISSGQVWRGEIINRAKDGSLIHEHSTISPVRDDSGAIINYVQIATDITTEENLRQQLTQAQKMEAIGTLAGGIAHDFNNIIQAITGYTELAMDQIEQGSVPHKNLQKVMSAAQRSKDMVRQILSFSRRSQVEQKDLDICPLLKEGLKFLRAAIPPTINIESSVSSKPCRVFADPTQIHQVLMNLCVNASQAIIGAKGTITVELDQTNLSEAFTALHPPLRPGNHVRLKVSDDGSGIPQEIMGKIFDPYFTTKEAGEGTGLGLSVVHGIVSSCNGAITAAGRPGGGTEFIVYFQSLNHNANAPEVEDEPRPLPRGDERILVVDDESILLEMYSRQLERLGYKVSVSQSAEEALALLARDGYAFDLVVTDLMMPGISGIELAREISEKWPGIHVIICTGWGDRISDEETVRANIRGIVAKPALSNEIAFLIRKIMDEH